MNCIYLNCFKGGECLCHAQATRLKDTVLYKPTREELKKYCKTFDFRECARYQAFQEHLKASTK